MKKLDSRGGSLVLTMVAVLAVARGCDGDDAEPPPTTATAGSGGQAAGQSNGGQGGDAGGPGEVRLGCSTDQTAPTQPAAVNAAAQSASEVHLSWSSSTDDGAVAGYRVYRDGTLVGLTDSTQYDDRGLEPQQSYEYRVTAYDDGWNESSTSEPATAETVAPESSCDFTVDDCATADLTQPGTYCLSGDLSSSATCLNVQTPSATIDCQHHSIVFGTQNTECAGILSTEDATEVRNCTISYGGSEVPTDLHGYSGVQVGSNGRVHHNTITVVHGNYSHGVRTGAGGIVFGNDIRATAAPNSSKTSAVYPGGASIVHNNTLTVENGWSVFLEYNDGGNLIVANDITMTKTADGHYYAMSLSANNRVLSNQIVGAHLAGSHDLHGLDMDDPGSNIVSDNTIDLDCSQTGNCRGIYGLGHDNVFWRNRITTSGGGNTPALRLRNTTGVLIQDNEINSGSAGLQLGDDYTPEISNTDVCKNVIESDRPLHFYGFAQWSNNLIHHNTLRGHEAVIQIHSEQPITDALFSNVVECATAGCFHVHVGSPNTETLGSTIVDTVIDSNAVDLRGTSDLLIAWSFSLQVADEGAQPVAGAQIELRSSLDTVEYSGQTNGQGRSDPIILTEKRLVSDSSEQNYSPYQLTITAAGFVPHQETIQLDASTEHSVSLSRP